MGDCRREGGGREGGREGRREGGKEGGGREGGGREGPASEYAIFLPCIQTWPISCQISL